MKKSISNIIKSVLFFSAVFLTASCEVGLGPAVDLTPPVVEIKSHKDNDSVARTFVLFGTASDNDAVTSISIDFEDADIHYKVIPGLNWQKKISTNTDWTEILEDTNNYCRLINGVWNWSIDVDTVEKTASKTGNNYSLTALVTDKAGNSGRGSKTECSLIVDTQNPNVSIYKPELYTGTYSTIESKVSSFKLNDNNVISRLVNGEIILNGRQSDALSFKALRVQFDSGKLNSEVRKVTSGAGVNSIEEIDQLNESKLGDEQSPVVYFEKTLQSADLREWGLVVKPEDWITDDSPLKTGKHIIRVVTTSLSSSNAWEKRVAGYFVWWPEADIPWIKISAGSEIEKIDEPYECYPGSDFSGNVYDDDAIKSVTTQVYKRVKKPDNSYEYVPEGNPENHNISSGSPKYCAWSIKVPSENAYYKVQTTAWDYTCPEPVVMTKYFKTADVSAPVIEVTEPADNTSAIQNVAGDINFNVKATDNSKVDRFEMVWLNPAQRTTPENKIKFLTGEADEWDSATPEGYTDSNGNKIYLLDSDKPECVFNKSLNLYDDFGIDGDTKTLVTQEFVFRAIDASGSKTVKAITLTGDSEAPTLEFEKITINGTEQSFENDNIPSFSNDCNQKEATIKGNWRDKFTPEFNNTSRMNKLEVKWGSNTKTFDVNPDGSWTASIASPRAGGTITAKLKDFGGNTRTVQAAVTIETSDFSLSRIDCEEDDGAYTTGKELNIILEFTKNTNVTGSSDSVKPELILNNGGIAKYVSGSGSTSHIFKYVVGSSDRDVEKLSVVRIDSKGCEWCDSAVTSSKLILSEPPAGANLGDTRAITIDKEKPGIKSVTVVSDKGYYKKDASILFKMEFTEDVTITNPGNLAVKFKHKRDGTYDVTADSPSVSGSNIVFFTYKVQDGENTKPIEFDSVIHTNVTVTDKAGNILSEWAPVTSPSFTNYIVDTTVPERPGFGSWNPSPIITSSEGTTFTISTNETDIATTEYSLDNGQNWVTYTGAVSVKNNGTYTVKARQTDFAGNESPATDGITFVIDQGDILTRITADTVNGTYSTNTDTKTIKGKLIFRKEVKIPKGTKVVLNVKNGSDFKTVPLNECKSGEGSSREFTFDYTITDGDSIVTNDVNKYLDVTAVQLSNGNPLTQVTVVEHSQNTIFDFPDSGEKRFKENRFIKVLTGKPEIQNVSISEGILNIVFDRNISKGSGSIVIEYSNKALDGTTDQKFYVPAVLSAEEYNELKSNSNIIAAYKSGTNGAVKTGNYLKNDTSTKYILDIEIPQDNDNLVTEFKNAGKHRVTVPVISDQVYVTSSTRSSEGNILALNLTSTYALPVKGAVYKVLVPAGAVSDEVKNKNLADESNSFMADGVESPEIRIVKPSYSITIPEAATTIETRTKTSTVDITPMQTATMYLSSRTPGAGLKYGLSSSKSPAITVHSNPINVSTTKTSDVTVPESIGTSYPAEGVELGNGSGNSVGSYANAAGLKIAIGAIAQKGNETSSPSYEYAARTVVKFNLAHYRDPQESTGHGDNERLTGLWFKDLKIYISGGDSPFGQNSIESFPLSWTDPSKFKIMAGQAANKATLLGQFWWVSWDITATTYIGFVAGNVPEDVNTNGPSAWFIGDYHWTLIKDQYPLYPGETLIMSAHGEKIADNSDGYYIPYGAKFAFNNAKFYTR